MANTNLKKAKAAKNDEFYTQLEDIEAELRHYPEYFKDKTIFCNCDDPFESNFTLFFLMHFNRLGLKRLISTGYATSPIAGRKIKKEGTYCLDISDTKHALKENQKDLNANDALHMLQTEVNLMKILNGDEEHLAGDFRSKESLIFLEESDVVVGNPPFSLFREYITMLEKHEKKYLIIGEVNQITDKDFFPLIESGKVWMGITMNGTGAHWFEVPKDYKNKNVKVVDGKRLMTNGRACWWTNLDYAERHNLQPLGYQYTNHESDYPKYDNYDVIDIGFPVKNGKRRGDFFRTPYDYSEIMGIPVTALGKLCPEQFEIIGITASWCESPSVKLLKTSKKKRHNPIMKGIELYRRLLVRNRQPDRTDWENWQREIDEARKGYK